MLSVGFESWNYGAAKNTYAPVPGVDYQKIRRIPFELGPARLTRSCRHIFVPIQFERRSVDLMHLWNRVSFGRVPWGSSFEFDFPVLDRHTSRGWAELQRRRLLDPSCRFIIAISDHARRRFVNSLPDATRDETCSKLHMIMPSHVLARRERPFQAPNDHSALKLMFVGVTFFGKGGEAVLTAFEKSAEELNLELTVVSPVAGNDYGDTPPADVDIDRIRRRLIENPRIRWIDRCSNENVLQMVQDHHVGLLPTFADTFGYAALEFMALGTPSIVSNVQALPEFTGPDTGWQVTIPVDDEGIWLGRTPNRDQRRDWYHRTVADAMSQLESHFRRVRNEPTELVLLSESTRRRYERQFDPPKRAAQLASIYRGAVEGGCGS